MYYNQVCKQCWPKDDSRPVEDRVKKRSSEEMEDEDADVNSSSESSSTSGSEAVGPSESTSPVESEGYAVVADLINRKDGGGPS